MSYTVQSDESLYGPTVSLDLLPSFPPSTSILPLTLSVPLIRSTRRMTPELIDEEKLKFLKERRTNEVATVV